MLIWPLAPSRDIHRSMVFGTPVTCGQHIYFSVVSVFVPEGQSGRVFPKCVDRLWCDMWPGGRDGGRENCDMVRIYSGISHDIWSKYTPEYRTIYGQNKELQNITTIVQFSLEYTEAHQTQQFS